MKFKIHRKEISEDGSVGGIDSATCSTTIYLPCTTVMKKMKGLIREVVDGNDMFTCG